MGKQDGHPNSVTRPDRPPSSLLLLADIANLLEIERAFGPQGRLSALERLHQSIRHLFDGEEIEVIENGGPIEVIVPAVAMRSFGHPGRLVGQLCALVCARPIVSESGSFLAVPSIGSAMLASVNADLEAARTQAHMQVRSWPIGCGRTLEASRYREDMRMAASLLEKVANGHARMVWQPTVASTIGSRVYYYESLLRIGEDDGNLRGCEPELRALERMDLSPELDRRLMALVLEELEADPTLRLGINISARSASLHRYGQNALWGELRERLDEKPDLASRLIIEITETADFASLEDACEFISLMQGLGCLIAIDDFGAGRGSIIQLSALAADIIKIDGHFVRDASRNDQGYAIFLHLLQLGSSLAPTVVVEGIETALQADLARKAGAHCLQGYQFGRPSTARALPMADTHGVAPSPRASCAKAGTGFAPETMRKQKSQSARPAPDSTQRALSPLLPGAPLHMGIR